MSTSKTPAPFGGWRSEISASALTKATVNLSEPHFDSGDIYWLESRPREKGRNTVVCLREGGSTPHTLLPHPINVRSKVHEYGGGCYCVHRGVIYFVLADDQRIYQVDCREASTGNDVLPMPLTVKSDCRYADLVVDARHSRLLAVCEDHNNGGEPKTSIVAIPLVKPGSDSVPYVPKRLVSGNDFYSNPRLSPNGRWLSWLSWNHPNMPWDACECWVAELDANGDIKSSEKIAGGPEESIFQPQWSPNGRLYFVSDRNNWWNFYCVVRQQGCWSRAEAVLEQSVEFASPHWVFGLSTYDFIDSDHILCCYTENGLWKLAILDVAERSLQTLESELSDIAYVRCRTDRRGQALFLGASPSSLNKLYRFDCEPAADLSRLNRHVIARSSETEWHTEWISQPRPVEFPSNGNGERAHGFFYPPQNPNYRGPEDEQPPLIVLCHGGPTAATHGCLNLKIQYWTSRGFAVMDINYGGSTGYGRHYRQRLNHQWGIVDVQDATAAVKYLAGRDWIDPDKVVIKGSSAGGYTVLAALTFTDVFKAGASYYGIGDLETLAQDTHKFESRYLDNLVGPYPEHKEIYQQRSPIHHVEQLNCPVIFFQGLEDKVVPPNQAQTMVHALKEKHIPVAYVEFTDEGHGFRQAANIERAVEAELYFYSKVFRFPLADEIEPVEIENLF